MGKVLFFPLNANHVLIFESIIKLLPLEVDVLCHDRISEGAQYHTESVLRQKQISHIHFPRKIVRKPDDNILLKLITFFRMRNQIKTVLREIAPDLIVFAIDNDPIAQIMISESKRQGIKTVLIPEGLIKPSRLFGGKKYLSDFICSLLRSFGIYLAFTKYGMGGCDKILVSGKRALEMLRAIGIPENKMTIVGLQKYDSFLRSIGDSSPRENKNRVYLYAASKRIFEDEREIKLLRKIIESSEELEFHVMVKFHPLASSKPGELYKHLEGSSTALFEIVKEGGYDTLEILKKVDAVITIPSAMIFEALIMNRECIIISYLTEETLEDYAQYDAVFYVKGENEVYDVLKNSSSNGKSYENKKRLLEDELYKLDGMASARAAEAIENMVNRY